MYDQVIVSADMLTVISNNSIQKFKEYFVWILIPLCALFSIVIFKNVDSQIKYFFVPIFVALILYYKFVYLRISARINKSNNQKLCVLPSKIEYFNGMHTYIIPMDGIASIEDISRYHDFQGRNERGWNHTFIIKLRDNCNICRVASSKEVYLSKQDIPEIQVFNLVVKHSDYEDILSFIRRLLIQ